MIRSLKPCHNLDGYRSASWEMIEMGRKRFQFSLRTLLLATLAVALLLVPLAWVSRERQKMLAARDAMLQARELAVRSVVLEGQRRRDETGAVQRLERENADLRQELTRLRRELEALRNTAQLPGKPQG